MKFLKFTAAEEEKICIYGTSLLIQKLEEDAREAARLGDKYKYDYLQAEADLLRRRLLEDGHKKVDDHILLMQGDASIQQIIHDQPHDNRQGQVRYIKRAPVDPEVLKVQWAALEAEQVIVSKNTTIFDCGERGKVTISATGINVRWATEDDPLITLLAMRHAQLNWDGRIFCGTKSEEIKFKAAVAAEMLGINELNAEIPSHRRAEAAKLAKEWQPILDKILPTAEPYRPTMQDGRQRTAQAATASAA